MRLQTVLPFLVASASAIPFPEELSSFGKNEKNSKAVPICSQNFSTEGVVDKYKKDYTNSKWQTTTAAFYLSQLTENGTKGWADKLFHDSGIGGGPTTSSYDCTRLSKDTCGPTVKCTDYSPNAAYFVHASMVNLNSFFTRMHEKLQDIGIWQLSGGIKEIRDTFGAPPKDMGGLFSILIGVFVLGAGLSGPVWKVGAPLTAGVGILNLAAGADADDENEPDLNDDLEKKFGKLFSNYAAALESAVKMFFSGDFSDSDDDINGRDLIIDTFKDGTLVENGPVNDAVDDWMDNVNMVIVSIRQDIFYLTP